jgi:hypothetical protein
MKNKIATKEYDKYVEKMTPKQAKFLALWLETGNGTRSAMEAYGCDAKSAGVISTENLAKLKNPTKLFLENSGLNLKHLLSVLADALKAEKTDITGDKHPDHKIRMEAVDRLAKWMDVSPAEPNQVNETKILVMPTVLIDKYGVS